MANTKKITLENMADKFGARYKECVNENNLEYMVELGISSGLKAGGFNTEKLIAHPLDLGPDRPYAESEIAIPHYIATLQCRELLAKQCRLTEEALVESRRANALLSDILREAKR